MKKFFPSILFFTIFISVSQNVYANIKSPDRLEELFYKSFVSGLYIDGVFFLEPCIVYKVVKIDRDRGVISFSVGERIVVVDASDIDIHTEGNRVMNMMYVGREVEVCSYVY